MNSNNCADIGSMNAPQGMGDPFNSFQMKPFMSPPYIYSKIPHSLFFFYLHWEIYSIIWNITFSFPLHINLPTISSSFHSFSNSIFNFLFQSWGLIQFIWNLTIISHHLSLPISHSYYFLQSLLHLELYSGYSFSVCKEIRNLSLLKYESCLFQNNFMSPLFFNHCSI